jgi:hypothetical protein
MAAFWDIASCSLHTDVSEARAATIIHLMIEAIRPLTSVYYKKTT